ncbi:MAG TPA: HAMP domain-containing sensor histidine kinase [Chitinophagaceae bacterium]
MPVRLRITLLFTAIAIVLLAFVCGTVYYISYTNRAASIETRLINRAITTARLLSISETFDREVLRKIDSLTASALKHKTVQAYDVTNSRIYFFSDSYADTIHAEAETLDLAREKGSRYFKSGSQDVVAYHFTERNKDIILVSAAYDELGWANLKNLSFVLITSSIVGVIIAVFSGYFFSARLLSPIASITKQVNEISAQNLTNRIPTGDVKDEWYHLTSTLNNLLNRLQESFETQRRFVSNASHELSTPLTSISSQLQVYLQKERKPEEYRKVMHSVYQDVQHMSQLTRTLLEMAKTSGDAGGLELNLIRIDEILLRLPAALQKINSQYSVALSFIDLPDDEFGLYVFGNEELLATAFKNIVMNACKYSDNRQAEISLSAKSGTIEVSIRDRGKGIDEAELKKIFEPFYRSDDLKNTEGFGLGLSLALKIIKIHKGDINVYSTPGEGSTFVVILPSTSKQKQRGSQ